MNTLQILKFTTLLANTIFTSKINIQIVDAVHKRSQKHFVPQIFRKGLIKWTPSTYADNNEDDITQLWFDISPNNLFAVWTKPIKQNHIDTDNQAGLLRYNPAQCNSQQ